MQIIFIIPQINSNLKKGSQGGENGY